MTIEITVFDVGIAAISLVIGVFLVYAVLRRKAGLAAAALWAATPLALGGVATMFSYYDAEARAAAAGPFTSPQAIRAIRARAYAPLYVGLGATVLLGGSAIVAHQCVAGRPESRQRPTAPTVRDEDFRDIQD